jgi:hypothetical protein
MDVIGVPEKKEGEKWGTTMIREFRKLTEVTNW